MQQDNTSNNPFASILSFANTPHTSLLLNISPAQNITHPHYVCLYWFITTLTPQAIIILDNETNDGVKHISYIIDQYNFTCEVYGHITDKKQASLINSCRALPDSLKDIPFDCLYIDVSKHLFAQHPLLSELTETPPQNTFLFFDKNLCDNSISKENSHFIAILKQTYPYFQFTHYKGFLVIYTGNTDSLPIKEIFTLDKDQQTATYLRKYFATLDHYCQLQQEINGKTSISNQQQLIECKTKSYLLQQQIDHTKSVNSKLTAKIAYFKEKLDTYNQELMGWKDSSLTILQQAIHNIIKITELHNHSAIHSSIKRKVNHVINMKKTINNVYIGQQILGNIHQDLNKLLSLSSIIEPSLSTKSDGEIESGVHQLLLKSDNKVSVYSGTQRPRRILFVAGEPHTPGVTYRCYRNADACKMAGHEATVKDAAHINPDDIRWADILVLWRVEHSGHIQGILDLAKEWNKLTAFDADDIVFKPQLAYIDIIDGIRTIGSTEAETSRTFGDMRRTMIRTDFAVATTQEMRTHMAQELVPRHAGPLIFILPNIFDDECVKTSRFFSRVKQSTENDSYIRIGYASGTRTHQRDFMLVIPALISIFKKRENVKLVLFREPENHRPILHMNEFPELKDYEDRIEWRDTVPLKLLPQELARFDISIAPLEVNNVFCNAKSELKFFEAALANVCSVVSTTSPMKRCIKHGETGFFAEVDQEWETTLLNLIDNPSLRNQIAQNAYHEVLWNFSIQRQSKLCDTMMQSLASESAAAKAMETYIARKEYKVMGRPIIPESEILFHHDALKESEVTVIITSYNYQKFILEALESVKAQTLPNIDLIIVDDGSSDDSIATIKTWAENHKDRFNRLQLHRSVKNAGLGGARNIGIAASETLYSMQLDADNLLQPNSCEKLLNKLKDTNIGFAYPQLTHFGAGKAIGGHVPFHPLRLTTGNYIDAMVMIAKWAWAAVGGYYVQRDAMGWEDYDIWCRFAEMGIQGTQVTDATAEYRAHFSSMTNTVTEQTHHKPKVVSYLADHHPWIDIVFPEGDVSKTEK